MLHMSNYGIKTVITMPKPPSLCGMENATLQKQISKHVPNHNYIIHPVEANTPIKKQISKAQSSS